MLYDFSKRIIQTYDSLHSKLQGVERLYRLHGTVRVATIYSIGLHDLPPYIKRFLKELSHRQNVHVEYRRANQVYDDVLSNLVDLGLVAYPVRNPKIETVPLRKDPLVADLHHPHHAFAKAKSLKLKSLAGQKFIGFEPDIPTRKALGSGSSRRSHVAVESCDGVRQQHRETVKRAVEIDAGISIVPQGTILQEVAKQTLAQVPLDDGDFFRPLAAIYKKNKVLSPAVKQFAGHPERHLIVTSRVWPDSAVLNPRG